MKEIHIYNLTANVVKVSATMYSILHDSKCAVYSAVRSLEEMSYETNRNNIRKQHVIWDSGFGSGVINGVTLLRWRGWEGEVMKRSTQCWAPWPCLLHLICASVTQPFWEFSRREIENIFPKNCIQRVEQSAITTTRYHKLKRVLYAILNWQR